jgi:outer membrane protein TolC
VTAYYQILTVEKLRQAAGEEVKQMTDHLRVAKDLYEQGMVTRNDVLQAQVKLAGSQQLLLNRENQLGNSWRTLNYLTGRPATARGVLEETAQKAPAAAAPAVAVARRPDLKAQQLLVAKSAAAVKSSRSDYYPVLFLRGDINYLKNDYVTQQTIYSATIGLQVNIFDGNVTTSRLRQAVQEETRDRDRLRDLQDRAVLEYQNARNDAEVARQRIAVAAQAISQAEENLRINENRYRENVGTGTDVIDAQTLLTQTRTDYDQALFDYQVAIARIRKAAGEL